WAVVIHFFLLNSSTIIFPTFCFLHIFFSFIKLVTKNRLSVGSLSWSHYLYLNSGL
ncbi:unnamed protein product, partial [Brassica rapa]